MYCEIESLLEGNTVEFNFNIPCLRMIYWLKCIFHWSEGGARCCLLGGLATTNTRTGLPVCTVQGPVFMWRPAPNSSPSSWVAGDELQWNKSSSGSRSLQGSEATKRNFTNNILGATVWGKIIGLFFANYILFHTNILYFGWKTAYMFPIIVVYFQIQIYN